jgi:SnoaL-like domain
LKEPLEGVSLVISKAQDGTAVGPVRASCGSEADLNGISLLLIRFSTAVDGKSPADVAALFTDDGVFKPAADAISGRAQIENFYRGRLADEKRRTCHVWSNLFVRPTGDTHAKVTVVLSNYAFEPSVSAESLQFRIGNVSGLCVKDDRGAWRFAEHVYERIFTAALPITAQGPGHRG